MKRLLLLSAVTFATALAACGDTKAPPVGAVPSVADSADQILIGTRYLMSTRGIQRGELLADTAYVLNDQTRFDLRHTNVNFTTETGAPQGTMEADRGIYSTQTQTMEGWGDVVLRLVDGRTLKSPHVLYNQLTHQVSSDSSFTITRNADTYSGIGFTSNESFTSFKCLANCGGTFSVLLPEK